MRFKTGVTVHIFDDGGDIIGKATATSGTSTIRSMWVIPISVLSRTGLAQFIDEPVEEPALIDPGYEEPHRFERLCYRALAEGVIGDTKAVELLDSGSSTNDWVNAWNKVCRSSSQIRP